MPDMTNDEPMLSMAQRESKENPEWAEAAHKTMRTLIHRGTDFTTDDFHDIMGDLRPINRNSIGALFRGYSQAGYMTSVGYTQSKQGRRNGGGQRVWRGKLTEQYATKIAERIMEGD